MHLTEIENYNLDLTKPDNRAKMFEILKTLIRAVPKAQDSLTEMHLNGDEIPGYELKFRQGARGITDTKKAYEVVKEGVTLDAFLSACDVKIGALEQLVVQNTDDPRQAKANLNSALESAGALINKPETKYLTKSK